MEKERDKKGKKKGAIGAAKRALSFSKRKKSSKGLNDNKSMPELDFAQYADLIDDGDSKPQGSKKGKTKQASQSQRQTADRAPSYSMDDPAPAAPRRRLSAKPIKARYSGSDNEDDLDVPDYDIQAESARLARPSLGRTSARAIRPDSGSSQAKSGASDLVGRRVIAPRLASQTSHSRQPSLVRDENGSDLDDEETRVQNTNPSFRGERKQRGDESASAEPAKGAERDDLKEKKRHSTLGHIWKTVRNEIWTPTQNAAADIQAFSVSAAKQAGAVMSTVAERVEEDMSTLHDQILGGKRNLPDHAPGSARKLKGAGGSSEVGISVRADSMGLTTVDLGPSDRSMALLGSQTAILEPVASGIDGPEFSMPSSSASRRSLKSYLQKPAPGTSQNLPTKLPPGKRVSAPACLIIAEVGNGQPNQPSVAVEKSRPSAYMLDKYEEQPESPSKLAEAMSKTATAFTKGTETMLVGSKSSAIYLRRALMCGMAGRNKSKK